VCDVGNTGSKPFIACLRPSLVEKLFSFSFFTHTTSILFFFLSVAGTTVCSVQIQAWAEYFS
jgi:hypothetical protein